MGLYDEVVNKAKRVAAGLYQSTVANAFTPEDAAQRDMLHAAAQKRGGLSAVLDTIKQYDPTNLENYNYRPAAANAPITAAAGIKTLASIGAKKAGYPGLVKPVDPNGVLAASARGSSQAHDIAHEAVGVGPAEDWTDVVAEIGGEMLAGGPRIPAATATSLIGKVAQNTGRVAAEVVIPFRNTPLLSIPTALAPLIGAGTTELVHANVAPIEGYQGVMDDKPKPYVPPTPKSMRGPSLSPSGGFELYDNLGTTVSPPMEEGSAQSDFAAYDAIDEKFGTTSRTLPNIADQTKDITHEDASLFSKTAGAISVIAGLGVATGVGRYAYRQIKSAPYTGIAGTGVTRPTGSTGNAAIGAVLDQNQPIREAINEFAGPQHRANINYNMGRISNTAIGSKVTGFLNTGKLLNSTVRQQTPVGAMLNAYGKLDDVDQQAVSNALLAKTVLDDYKRTGVQAALNGKTIQELEASARYVDMNPKLKQFTDGTIDSHRLRLDYLEQSGYISSADAARMRAAGQNYVPLTRSKLAKGGIEDESATGVRGLDKTNLFDTRSTRVGGGVQVGEVANPMDTLSTSWRNTIRAVEINNFKRDVLTELDATGATRNGVRLVKELKGVTKKSDLYSEEGVHGVQINGRTVYYKVEDNALDAALEFAPRSTIQILDTMRQVRQSGTTGPVGSLFNLFQVVKSTAYDATFGVLARPEGTRLGIINEGLAKINQRYGTNLDIGVLDPTAFIAPYTGAVRGMVDDITQAAAQHLTENVLNQQGWLYSILGDAGTKAWADKLNGVYQNSIRASMDAEGVSSHLMSGTPDPSKPALEMAYIAPRYYSDQARRIAEESMRGNYKVYEKILAQGTNGFAAIRSNRIARMYTRFLYNLQEGSRYQFMATNLPRTKNATELNKLFTQTRRLTGDASLYGGNKSVQQFVGASDYLNISAQALSQIGHVAKESPAAFLMNMGALFTMGTMFKYGALFSDPTIAEKTRLRTDEQNARSILTFGGAEFALDPVTRIMFAPAWAMMDDAMGLNDGRPDPSFQQAINNMFDHEEDSDFQNEVDEKRLQSAFIEGARGMSPVDFENLPFATPILAWSGVDVGASRMTGEVTEPRVQEISTLGGEGPVVNSMTSSYMENLLAGLFGSSAKTALAMARDFDMALGANATTGAAWDSAMSTLEESYAKNAGPVKGMLFGDYETLKTVADTNFRLVQDKKKGYELAADFTHKDVNRQIFTNKDPHYSRMKAFDLPPSDYAGTQAAVIGAYATELKKAIKDAGIPQDLSAIAQVNESVQNLPLKTRENKNRTMNPNQDERKDLYMRQLMLVQQYEDQVRVAIDDPTFTFDGYDPKNYIKPDQTAQQQYPGDIPQHMPDVPASPVPQ